ncbi:UPF0481 protein At3g47200-like [Chenopodium quinoa]|uniref:UPF0481 protein At3g47200-like n=1 Tax=Chenopodium quinoa TaxID=63459 RepID=UPI000B797421|nr:UPF0481 protein At3g47200-like [Chenopodium quinoa]
MLRNKFISQHFKHFSRSPFAYARQISSKPLLAEDHQHYVASSSVNSSDYLETKMKAMHHQQQQLSRHSNRTSIYRASEKLKWLSMNRLVGLGEQTRGKLDKLVADLEDIEHEARQYYSEDVKITQLSRDEFVNMMLLDGCFIVELFKELNENKFASPTTLLPKRWMLPAVRRDLITLENQLPMIVLKKIFDETRTKSMEETSLEWLALCFFNPLMFRDDKLLQRSYESIASNPKKTTHHHLLDLFHSSITPGDKEKRGEEDHMYRSVRELKEAGIKVRVLDSTQPLELKFERGVLRMPSLQIDNHTESFFRNIVAYEQCHHVCKPDITTYLFFLDKLINSTKDVELLHYEGVIQHTLGSNRQVAKLVNNLCIEVEHDGKESYLYDVVEDINEYSNRWSSKAKAKLKHDYFCNVWVGISTIAALLLLYLTLLQTSCDVKQHLQENKGLWIGLHSFLIDPFEWFHNFVGSASKYRE